MKVHDIDNIDDLIDSKLEWCDGLVLWDKAAENFLCCGYSMNDPYDEDDYDDEGNLVIERFAFNAWCTNIDHLEVEDGQTRVVCYGDHDTGGLACPRTDMPMNEFITLLCAMCGENFERDLTEEECRDRFVLIKFYASSVYVDAMKQP